METTRILQKIKNLSLSKRKQNHKYSRKFSHTKIKCFKNRSSIHFTKYCKNPYNMTQTVQPFLKTWKESNQLFLKYDKNERLATKIFSERKFVQKE